MLSAATLAEANGPVTLRCVYAPAPIRETRVPAQGKLGRYTVDGVTVLAYNAMHAASVVRGTR